MNPENCDISIDIEKELEEFLKGENKNNNDLNKVQPLFPQNNLDNIWNLENNSSIFDSVGTDIDNNAQNTSSSPCLSSISMENVPLITSEVTEDSDFLDNEEIQVEYWTSASRQHIDIGSAFSAAPKNLFHENDFNFVDSNDTSEVSGFGLDAFNDLNKEDQELLDEVILHKGKRKKKSSKMKKSRNNLTPDAQLLMNSANTAFLDGDYESARSFLQEVVKLCPKYSEAFHTLGMIEEDTGNIDKAMVFYMVAAHLKPSDVNLWKRLAEISIENDMVDQAIYCLNMCIKEDSDDVDALMERSGLYLDKGKLKKALSGYLIVLRVTPFDLGLAEEISGLYLKLNDPEKAKSVFEAVMSRITNLLKVDLGLPKVNLSRYPNSIIPNTDELQLRLDHVNMLAELYMSCSKYEKSAQLIEKSLYSSLNPSKSFEDLPIDLRVKLGISKLYLNQAFDMEVIFGKIDNIEPYLDLIKDVAMAYYYNLKHLEAEKYFRIIINFEEYNREDNWICLADCLKDLGKYEQAVKYYKKVLLSFPDQKEIKSIIAQIMENMGEESKAESILEDLRQTRTQSKVSMSEIRNGDIFIKNDSTIISSKTLPDSIQNSLPNNVPLKSIEEIDPNHQWQSSHQKYRNILKFRDEGAKQNYNRTTFEKCLNLYGKYLEAASSAEIGETQILALEELLALSRKLLDEFSFSDFFYRRYQGKKQGFNSSSASKKSRPKSTAPEIPGDLLMDIEEAKSENLEFDERNSSSSESDFDELKMEDDSTEIQFKGLSSSEWEKLNYIYAITCFSLASAIKKGENEYSMHCFCRRNNFISYSDACKKLITRSWKALLAFSNSNIVKSDRKKRLKIRLYLLAFGILSQNWHRVLSICRNFIGKFSRYSDPYMLMSLVTGSGVDSIDACCDSRLKKYFHRLSSSEKFCNDPYVLISEAHILQLNRSFVAAIYRYLQVIKICPSNPLPYLCAGVALINRAIQRRTENRHCQIIQGISCIKKYFELRTSNDLSYSVWLKQECLFNFGRLFMMLGLNDLAFNYFENAIQVAENNTSEEYDLTREAAYCLSRLYADAGATALARKVLRQHCTI